VTTFPQDQKNKSRSPTPRGQAHPPLHHKFQPLGSRLTTSSLLFPLLPPLPPLLHRHLYLLTCHRPPRLLRNRSQMAPKLLFNHLQGQRLTGCPTCNQICLESREYTRQSPGRKQIHRPNLRARLSIPPSAGQLQIQDLETLDQWLTAESSRAHYKERQLPSRAYPLDRELALRHIPKVDHLLCKMSLHLLRQCQIFVRQRLQ
jgi:hypothetical protein